MPLTSTSLYPFDELSGNEKLFSNTGKFLKKAMQSTNRIFSNYYIYKSCYLFNISYVSPSAKDTSIGELMAFTAPLLLPHESTSVSGESGVSYRKDDNPRGYFIPAILRLSELDKIFVEIVKAREIHGNISFGDLIKQFERYLFITNGNKISNLKDVVKISDIRDFTMNIKECNTANSSTILISCFKRDKSKNPSDFTAEFPKGPEGNNKLFFALSYLFSFDTQSLSQKNEVYKDTYTRRVEILEQICLGLQICIRETIMSKLPSDLADLDDESFAKFIDDVFALTKITFDLTMLQFSIASRERLSNKEQFETFCYFDNENSIEVSPGVFQSKVYFTLFSNLSPVKEEYAKAIGIEGQFLVNFYHHFVLLNTTSGSIDLSEKDDAPPRSLGKMLFGVFLVSLAGVVVVITTMILLLSAMSPQQP